MAAIARYFDASTFDAFRFLSSKLKILNVRELGHEFSHSLSQEATYGRSCQMSPASWLLKVLLFLKLPATGRSHSGRIERPLLASGGRRSGRE